MWEGHQGWAKGISVVTFLKDLELRAFAMFVFPTALGVFIS